MKELSIEQKAQRYDEALERVRSLSCSSEYEGYKKIFESIFPELAESEDEKIINNIKKVIGWYRGMFTEKSLMPEEYQEINAWLEKQGEQRNHVWHDASEIPPKGKEVCILWEDGLITTGTWYCSDVWSDRMRYWCLSSQILPINKHKRKE